MMLEDLKTPNRPLYDFKDPAGSYSLDTREPLVARLLATRAFQRLKEVRFLGGIDYLFAPTPNGARRNIRYTRYQHSLGVATLAQLYCDTLDLPSHERRLVIASALLHDVGHAPLSHSLEPVFEDLFGIEHHKATIAIIRGDFFGSEIAEVLRDFSIDVDRLSALISGQETGYNGLFSGAINFDTIEGVLRTAAYILPGLAKLTPGAVTLAALRKSGKPDRETVDEFWHQKDSVYRHVINSADGVLADHACQAFMRRHIDRFEMEDYFSTEDRIFSKLPGLRALLTSPAFGTKVWLHLADHVPYKARRFFVEANAGDGLGRYKQEKHDRMLSQPREISVSRREQRPGLLL
jgi:uncharacterized protein